MTDKPMPFPFLNPQGEDGAGCQDVASLQKMPTPQSHKPKILMTRIGGPSSDGKGLFVAKNEGGAHRNG